VAAIDARNARLLREAQALAKLAHPNVVAVHDVGTVDDQVWIAMEFITGETLSGLVDRQKRRGWREVVATYLAAGDGARGGSRGWPGPPRLQAATT
jgi:serine/threonine protein kinase